VIKKDKMTNQVKKEKESERIRRGKEVIRLKLNRSPPPSANKGPGKKEKGNDFTQNPQNRNTIAWCSAVLV